MILPLEVFCREHTGPSEPCLSASNPLKSSPFKKLKQIMQSILTAIYYQLVGNSHNKTSQNAIYMLSMF